MKVYLDVLLLRELLIDGVLLLLTGWVRGTKPKPWRLMLASFIGGLYTIAMLFPSLSSLYHISIKLLVSILMIYITFGFYSLQSFLKDIVSFYVISCVAAGGMMAFYYLLMRSSAEVWSSLVFVGGGVTAKLHISIFYAISSLCIILYLFTNFVRSKKKQMLVANHLADVEIVVGNECFSCRGLIDTGNQLYDPLTKSPVMILQVDCLPSIFPEQSLQLMKKGNMNDVLMLLSNDQSGFPWQDRLRIIPYRGVNKGSQFLLAIKPDLIKVNYDGHGYESQKVLIGFEGEQLSVDGSYQAIIHPSMIVNE